MENKKEKNSEEIKEPIKSILDNFYHSAGYTKFGQEKAVDKKESKEKPLEENPKTLDF